MAIYNVIGDTDTTAPDATTKMTPVGAATVWECLAVNETTTYAEAGGGAGNYRSYVELEAGIVDTPDPTTLFTNILLKRVGTVAGGSILAPVVFNTDNDYTGPANIDLNTVPTEWTLYRVPITAAWQAFSGVADLPSVRLTFVFAGGNTGTIQCAYYSFGDRDTVPTIHIDGDDNDGLVFPQMTLVGAATRWQALAEGGDASYLRAGGSDTTLRSFGSLGAGFSSYAEPTPQAGMFVNLRMRRVGTIGAGSIIAPVPTPGGAGEQCNTDNIDIAGSAIATVFTDYHYPVTGGYHAPGGGGSPPNLRITVVTAGSTTGYIDISYASFGASEDAPAVTVTASSGAHCEFDQEGVISIGVGDDLTLTATADTGYVIEEILVDDVPVEEAVGLTEYELVLSDVLVPSVVSVSATGAVQNLPAAVTVSVSPSGSGKRLGQVMFANPNARTGETTTIRVKPSPGGRIKTVVIDGDDISAAHAATWAAAPGGTEFLIEEYEVPAEPAIEATFVEAVDTGGGSYRSGSLTAGAGVENFADRTANVEAALRRDYPVQPF